MLSFSARDVHPPLFYVLLKVWLLLSGAHFLTAKYLAIAASLPALPLLYQLGRRLLPDWTAVVAGLVLTVAPAALFLAPTVRDFSLGLTLSLATMILTLDLCCRSSPSDAHVVARLCGLALLTGVALLTWYFQLFLLPAQALVLLFARRRLVAAHAALVVGCLMALPWYAYVWPHVSGKLALGTTTFGGRPHLPGWLALGDGLARALFGAPLSRSTVAAGAAWLIVFLLGTFVASTTGNASPEQATRLYARRALPAPHLLLGMALLFGALEVAITTLRWSDIGSLSRYVLPLLPYLSIVQARALTGRLMWRRVVAIASLAVFIPVQLVWFASLVSSTPIDWAHDQALAYVAAHARAGDALLFNDRARRGRYVLNGGSLPTAVIHTAGQAYLADTAAQGNATVLALAQTATRIWLIENAPSVDVAQRALARQAFGLPPITVDGSVVQLFLAHSATPRRPIGVVLGGVITLDAVSLPATASPGADIPVELDWRDVRPTTVPYTVFLHLKDGPASTVAQHDSPPGLGFAPTDRWRAGQRVIDRFGLHVPASLPAGNYAIHVGLYRGDTRLTAPNGSNLIDLGTLHIGG
ncbi:MAG TPA: glycosyltransferase family 39 protein [Chloroflexota bacterium]